MSDLPKRTDSSNSASKEAQSQEPEHEGLIKEFLHSAVYTAIQEPTTGICQLVDHARGTNLEEKTSFISKPDGGKGTADWIAQQLGSAAGMMIPLLLVRGGVRKALGGTVKETLEVSSLGLSLKEAGLTGFAYNSLLTPTDSKASNNFWVARGLSGLSGAATFTTMTASAYGLGKLSNVAASREFIGRSTLVPLLRNQAAVGILSGVPAGLVSAEGASLANNSKLATGQEIKQSIAGMAFIGGAFGVNEVVKAKYTGGKSIPRFLAGKIYESRTAIGDASASAVETKTNDFKTINDKDIESAVVASNNSLGTPVKVNEYPSGLETDTGKATRISEYADGTKVYENPDGLFGPQVATSITKFPDGRYIEVLRSDVRQAINGKLGFVATLETLPDGTKISRNPQGLYGPDSPTESFFDRKTGRVVERGWAHEREAMTPAQEAFLKKTVADIHQKYTTDLVGQEHVDALIGEFSDADKPLARAFLERGVPNSSDQVLMDSLREAGTALESASGKPLSTGNLVFSAGPETAGNAIAYLFRKAVNRGDIDVVTLDRLPELERAGQEANGIGSALRPGDPIVLFDDVSKLTTGQREALSLASEQGHPIYAVDMNNFEGGLNFTDIALGRASAKLHQLVDAAKERLQQIGPATVPIDPATLADETLRGQQDSVAKKMGITIVRPTTRQLVDPRSKSIDERAIENYLEHAYPSVEDRLIAAELLANAADYHSLAGITRDAQGMHGLIQAKLGTVSITTTTTTSPSTDARSVGCATNNPVPVAEPLYLIGFDSNLSGGRPGGASSGFMSYVFKVANNLTGDNFAGPRQLASLASKGSVENLNPFVIDDVLNTGSQSAQVRQTILRSLLPPDYTQSDFERAYDVTHRLTQAYIGAYRYGVERGNGPFVTALQLHDRLGEGDRSQLVLKQAVAPEGSRSAADQIVTNPELTSFLDRNDAGMTYGKPRYYQILPYMTPDNVHFTFSDFARQILGISNPFHSYTRAN